MTPARRRFSVLVLLPLLLQLTGASSAGAAVLACGATITTDTVLENDIGPCPDGGLRVTVSGVVLDLNGHRVFGSPSPTDGLGIHLFRVSGVTVRNGTVSDFDGGVAIEGGEQNTVEFVTARDNIGRQGVTLAGEGIAILSSRNNQLYGNNVVNNGPFAGIGLYTNEEQHPRTTTGPSTGNLVDSNTITRNIIDPAGGTVNTQIAGIRAANNSTHNTYVNNRITDNGLDGISLFRGSGNSVIRGNIVTGHGFFRTAARRGSGIIVFNEANNNLIEHNLVTNNGDNGISLRPTV
ncbi:MAG: right-handed parallel beta-helix repeat-containing protein, partial [Actinobacteria bacterium]|nr:right-handed parallel beta-helix repeat-containing protein [Actinomycetota bacterium]